MEELLKRVADLGMRIKKNELDRIQLEYRAMELASRGECCHTPLLLKKQQEILLESHRLRIDALRIGADMIEFQLNAGVDLKDLKIPSFMPENL